ncbi:MAG TPA: retropepsin-like aspartic protease [Chitinophagaceae bacterium]|nr:retropepsin-like aspartic protease [Chitinophagaceae bacterium]
MKKEKYTQIPITLNMIGHLEVEVKIDNVKARFLVDTGASNTVIDIGFAKENGMEFASIEEQGGGVGTSQMVLFHKQVDIFKINELEIPSFDLYATDFTHVKDSLAKKGIAEPCHGVIGADILIKYKAKINYKKRKLYLKK